MIQILKVPIPTLLLPVLLLIPIPVPVPAHLVALVIVVERVLREIPEKIDPNPVGAFSRLLPEDISLMLVIPCPLVRVAQHTVRLLDFL